MALRCPGVAYQRGPFTVFYKRDARAVRLPTPPLWHGGLFKRSRTRRAALNNGALLELTRCDGIPGERPKRPILEGK